jgi:hypothetical protein
MMSKQIPHPSLMPTASRYGISLGSHALSFYAVAVPYDWISPAIIGSLQRAYQPWHICQFLGFPHLAISPLIIGEFRGCGAFDRCPTRV